MTKQEITTVKQRSVELSNQIDNLLHSITTLQNVRNNYLTVWAQINIPKIKEYYTIEVNRGTKRKPLTVTEGRIKWWQDFTDEKGKTIKIERSTCVKINNDWCLGDIAMLHRKLSQKLNLKHYKIK